MSLKFSVTNFLLIHFIFFSMHFKWSVQLSTVPKMVLHFFSSSFVYSLSSSVVKNVSLRFRHFSLAGFSFIFVFHVARRLKCAKNWALLEPTGEERKGIDRSEPRLTKLATQNPAFFALQDYNFPQVICFSYITFTVKLLLGLKAYLMPLYVKIKACRT